MNDQVHRARGLMGKTIEQQESVNEGKDVKSRKCPGAMPCYPPIWDVTKALSHIDQFFDESNDAFMGIVNGSMVAVISKFLIFNPNMVNAIVALYAEIE